MVPVTIQTLVVTNSDTPSILVLCPIADYEEHRTCRIVPIWLGIPEATQLGIAIERAKFARPLTHDLMLDALTELDCIVDHVEISDVKGLTFYARLVLKQGDRTIVLDARPSDAIALALRQDAPILMDERVLDQASFPFIFKSDDEDEAELARFHSFVENLTPDDFSQQDSDDE